MSGIPAGAGSLLGKRLGKYEILALLALGGTAEIYLARIAGAAGFEKYVVVKCLHDHLADDPEFVKMFLDEARLAAHLDHSNIVQTMELGEYENRYYMVMEFLAGLSLAMIIRRATERLAGGRLPVPLSLNIVAQACAGLHYAHERAINGKVLNIVHRDISPQNLVVSFEGVVKVVDFGIAKAELRETKTRSGTIKGKFAYMSPEQCVAHNVDRRTDVFALGVILWELLTGKRLFKRNSPYETYQAVIECKVEPASKHNHELDPALDAIVMKALSKDKENRYASAEAFGDALMSYMHHRGKGSGPNEVGRFFETQFSKEIDEHGARMRELIAQAAKDDFLVDTGVGWGEDDDKAHLTVDLSKKAAEAIAASDAMKADRASQQGLTGVIDELDEPSIDDDDMPADKTRIEANPLDRLNELNAEASKKPSNQPRAMSAPPASAAIPSLVKSGGAPAQSSTSNTLGSIPQAPVLPGNAADDDQATVALQHGQAPIPVIPAGMRKAAPGGQPSGRPSSPVLPPSGAVALPPPPSGPVHIGAGNASNRPGTAGPRSTTYIAQANPLAGNPHGPTNVAGPLPPVGGPPPRGMEAGAPPPGQMASAASGMSNPMAQTHVPSLGGAPARPSGFPASANLPTMIADPSGMTPAPTNAAHLQQTLQPENNYAPRGGDPYQSGPVPVQPMMPDSGSYSGVSPAHMMSPVGQNYPNQVDWAQAAAVPARAIPPWMLAALFAGVLLGALLITLLIAKIAT